MKPSALTVLAIAASVMFRAPVAPQAGGAPRSRAAVSIREHGAKGDGTTDDTAAVISAFSSACASGGGSIEVPAGTYLIDPATSPIPVCGHLAVFGTGTLRVKPDAGNYRFIFAPNPTTAAVDDLSFAGITIDQNARENTTAAISTDDSGSLQLVWQIFAGTNLHFSGMHLYVSGVDPIDVNGPTVSGVYIERNHVVFQKRRGQAPFDNSSVYIDGDNFHVTDNTFVSTQADAARTAIEIHTGSGSVSGNTIEGFSTGMNLVDLHGASVIGNHVRHADHGVSLWSTTTEDSVTLADNTVAVAQVTRATPTAWGIATSYNNGINGDFSNLQIAGNVLTFEQESSSRPISNHVNYGIGLQALGNISNVLVLGNEIVRAPVRGITVGVADGRYTTSRVSVRDNRIIDAGSNFSSGTSDYSAAIVVQGNLSAIDVVHNRLDFLSDPFIGHYSYWAREAGFTFRNVVVADNYTTAAHGTPLNALTPSVSLAIPRQ